MPSKTRSAGLRLPLLASVLAIAIASVVVAMRPPSSVAAPSLDQLQSELGAQQGRQLRLSGSIGSLDHLIDTLDGQLALVAHRELAVADELAGDRAKLGTVHRKLVAERARLVRLRSRLAAARALLSRQLVSGYESSRPTLVTVVLSSSGFQSLLNQLRFLGLVERSQRSLVERVAAAKRQTTRAAARLAKLERTDRRITHDALVRKRALVGMDDLLASKRSALSKARTARTAALRASRERGLALRHEISSVRAHAAAAAAARASAAAQQAADTAPSAPALGAGGGWAIPWPIVDCESGGQNLPPNSAGASGYYQIIPGTWREYGGTGPAAYLAPKAEQDAVARRIWDGSGPDAWDCARIVGIS